MSPSSPLAAFSRFTERQPKARLLAGGLALTLLCAALDYGLGAALALALAPLYLAPILALAWFWHWRAALAATALAAVLHYLIHAAVVPPAGMSAPAFISSGATFLIVGALARVLARLRLMIEYYYRGGVWQANQRPIQATPRILIVPSLSAKAPEVASGRAAEGLCLYLSPGMAFGTGSHPTTQLCLALLEQYIRPGERVLDVGSGTGVLSIAAVKLGAPSALAIDFDPEAAQRTGENAALNGVGDRIEFRFGSIEVVLSPGASASSQPSEGYALVLANLLSHIIVRLFDEGLARLVAPGGILILSGIRSGEAGSVLKAAKAAGLELVEERQRHGWLALAVKRN